MKLGNCSKCVYWEEIDKLTVNNTKIIGRCHKNAPTVKKSLMSAWPLVYEDEFCGEWVSKECEDK